jgi:hypothetical protein
MKKAVIFFGIFFCILLAKVASSQTVVNVTGGMNISSMKSSFSYSENKVKAGIIGGVTADIPINEAFGIETGLIYSIKGEKPIYTFVNNPNWWEYDTTTFKTSVNINYLELPVKAIGSLNSGNVKFIGYFGPYFGMALGGKIKTDETTKGNTISYTDYLKFGNNPMNSNIRRIDYGLSMGLGLNTNDFHIGVSYDLGLANLSPSKDAGNFSKNRSWSINIGSRINVGYLISPNYKLRIKAVKRIKNQEKLFKIVLEDEDWRVRQAAVNKISDQNILFKVAMDDENYNVKIDAFNKITDQNLINQLASESKEGNIRLLTVDKITDQSILYMMALFDISNVVKIAAFNKITDQNLINQLAVESKELNLRLLAVSKITDQNTLYKIAQTDSSEEVSIAALNKINDQNIIIRLATESKNPHIRILALKYITDENFIYKIALEDINYEVKVAAMNRLEPSQLAKLASDFKELELKLNVVKLLTDQIELMNISQNNDNWNVRKAAFKKLNDNTLDIIIQEAKDPALVLSAKIRLGRISWNEAFSGKGNSKVTLGHVIGAAAIVDSPQPTSYDVVLACHKFIRLGDASRIPELIYLLNNYGDVPLAEDYMNCGESTLEEAGCSWGRSHGYECSTGNYGSNRVRWGSQR